MRPTGTQTRLALSLTVSMAINATEALRASDDSPFHLAPAVAIEAEFFEVERGWRVIQNGRGNYMVDTIGFQHIGGERLLGIDEIDASASAHADVEIPEAGDYRLWVRYEYPPMTDARFRVEVAQDGEIVAGSVMGARDNPRYAFTDQTTPRPQFDPPWGAEGLAEEVIDVPGLRAGAARIFLKGTRQPQRPGLAARRNVDLVYLTSDTGDAWRAHYVRRNRLYPILDAFRDSVGPRWEVRFTNRGEGPDTYRIDYQTNRVRWRARQRNLPKRIAPGATTEWIGLTLHDIAHYHQGRFRGSEPFDLEIRPTNGGPWRVASEGRRLATTDEPGLRIYIPPYPHWGEPVVTPQEQIAATLEHLRVSPTPGRVPRQVLAYGKAIPAAGTTEYNRAYAALYKAIGMRGFPSSSKSSADLGLIGLPDNRSRALARHRNLPTDENIAKWKAHIAETGGLETVAWFDYGDEIRFSTWVKRAFAEDEIGGLWRTWLEANGAGSLLALHPDTTREAAHAQPRLYVDSLRFYEDSVIAWVADS